MTDEKTVSAEDVLQTALNHASTYQGYDDPERCMKWMTVAQMAQDLIEKQVKPQVTSSHYDVESGRIAR